MAKQIKITETALRDAHQSLIATRMTLDEMLPILDKMDKAGFYSLECWGGATFDSCLAEALEEECSYEVVRSVHAQISEIVEAHKESKDPEPLTISKATVRTVLENCGIAEEKLQKLDASLDESFGKNALLSPKNVVATKKFELETPDVKIKISPEKRDLVSTQVINNVKYVMIRVEGGVEVNGININIED